VPFTGPRLARSAFGFDDSVASTRTTAPPPRASTPSHPVPGVAPVKSAQKSLVKVLQ
jgi:hypothetical protein